MDGHRPNTYGDAFADVYDDWYHDVSDAKATADLVDAESAPGPIIELGVGSGRLAVPLLVLGRTVVGIDASRSMLDRCPPHPDLHLVEADMAAIPLRLAPGIAGFGGALCAFNTLFNLTSIEDQQQVFSQTAQLLAPGGALVVEAITGSDLAEGPRSSVGVSRMSVDEVVLSATLLQQDDQTISGQHIQISETGIKLRPWALRWATPHQLDEMATTAGLSLADRFADWDRSEFSASDPKHISIYRRSV